MWKRPEKQATPDLKYRFNPINFQQCKYFALTLLILEENQKTATPDCAE